MKLTLLSYQSIVSKLIYPSFVTFLIFFLFYKEVTGDKERFVSLLISCFV